MSEAIPQAANSNEAPGCIERTTRGVEIANDLLKNYKSVEEAGLIDLEMLLSALPEIKKNLVVDGKEYGQIKEGFAYAYRELANREEVAKRKLKYLEGLELIAA